MDLEFDPKFLDDTLVCDYCLEKFNSKEDYCNHCLQCKPNVKKDTILCSICCEPRSAGYFKEHIKLHQDKLLLFQSTFCSGICKLTKECSIRKNNSTNEVFAHLIKLHITVISKMKLKLTVSEIKLIPHSIILIKMEYYIDKQV